MAAAYPKMYRRNWWTYITLPHTVRQYDKGKSKNKYVRRGKAKVRQKLADVFQWYGNTEKQLVITVWALWHMLEAVLLCM
jgi:hypothetical protein